MLVLVLGYALVKITTTYILRGKRTWKCCGNIVFEAGGWVSKGTALCDGYWLWTWQISSWGIADLHCRNVKDQMVKTQTESHDRRPICSFNKPQSFEVRLGTDPCQTL
jgi:hypothetical protein